jgi:hemerythrin superfamily protein
VVARSTRGAAVADDARDILELLLEDHEDFRGLFDELDRTEPEQRDELFRYTVARLASHEAAEEAVVHSTVRDEVPGGREVAEARLEEEAEAERLLAQMSDMDATSEEFSEALVQLREEVLSHAEHEERDEFPKLREHLDADRRRDMGRIFETLRETGPTRPHPHTPQTPEVRAALGPIVGMFDRARDAARDAFSR